MTDWRDETNAEGFPVPNEEREGEFFVRYVPGWAVVYQCEFIDGLGWCWRQVDRTPW